ncbi:hypothetical protein BJ944DRAFT_169336 [Cunninghamella echinulata]|nr:hypothetical protein BJ944DRAFT_169336 [Cunninghamella echinulata]
MQLVKDLQPDQIKALQNLVFDISNLYIQYSDEYMNQWEKGCDNEKVLKDAPEAVKQVAKGSIAYGLFHVSRIIEVEPDYYTWEAQQRAFRINAPSKAHMCKSLIMENIKCTHNDFSGKHDSPVNTKTLKHFAHGLKDKTASKKYFNFRLADPEVSFELTGYKRGGVCPLGMKNHLPIITAESVTKLDVSDGYIRMYLCVLNLTLIIIV